MGGLKSTADCPACTAHDLPADARGFLSSGSDFGTTNTAVALADGDGPVRLARLPGPAGARRPPGARCCTSSPMARCTPAPRRSSATLATEGEGRLVQSIKSHLASALVHARPMICGRTWTLEALVAACLRGLRAGAPGRVDARRARGRRPPVRYWGAGTDADDARAVSRMREALALAGFAEVVFDSSPSRRRFATPRGWITTSSCWSPTSAAAPATSRWCASAPQVGPGDAEAHPGHRRPGGRRRRFDARIIDAEVAPALGRDTDLPRRVRRRHAGAELALLARLRRWHHLSFLKDADTLRLLDRLEQGSAGARADRPAGARREGQIRGCRCTRRSRRASRRCRRPRGTPGCCRAGPRFCALSTRRVRGLDRRELDGVDAVVAGVLARAGVGPGDVDTVFATGGSSLVPAVRRRLAARFGDGQAGRRRGADLGRLGPGRPGASGLRSVGFRPTVLDAVSPMPIIWFPGHMRTARKKAAETMSRTDLVIELLDARVPHSSCNPLFERLRRAGNRPALKLVNKSDLADADRRGSGWTTTTRSPACRRSRSREEGRRGRAAAARLSGAAARSRHAGPAVADDDSRHPQRGQVDVDERAAQAPRRARRRRAGDHAGSDVSRARPRVEPGRHARDVVAGNGAGHGLQARRDPQHRAGSLRRRRRRPAPSGGLCSTAIRRSWRSGLARFPPAATSTGCWR